MLYSVFLIISGALLLYFFSDLLVKGASSLANRYQFSQFFAGMTVVAIATSAPEFFVSLISAVRGYSDVSFGNVLGSNIANMGLILGISLVAVKTKKLPKIASRDLFFMLLSSVVLLLLAIIGVVTRMSGLVMVFILIFFIYSTMKNSRSQAYSEPSNSRYKDLIMVSIGSIGLTLASNTFLNGAISFADKIGLSQLFIGVSVVALGTSLPELAASLVALVKKNPSISIGNIIGSNIFNVFAVLGFVGIINKVDATAKSLYIDIPFIVLMSILTCFFLSRKKSKSLFGPLLLSLYVLYIVVAFYRG